MLLSEYLAQLQDLLHDAGDVQWTLASKTRYINEARKHVAARGECIRILPPSGTGQVETVAAQEVYPFSGFNAFVQLTAGVDSILHVKSIAVQWGAQRPILDWRPWSDLQAYLRSWQVGMPGPPAVWSQYGQGVNGSVYLYPIPSQVLPMDWDCVCLPVQLVDDTTVDLIPEPWSDAVQFYAAYKAYLNSQRFTEAAVMYNVNAQSPGLYQRAMMEARAAAEPHRTATYYPASLDEDA